MIDLSPLAPITLAGGILANLATDILRNHAQALEGTLAGRLLKRFGLLEPNFEDRLRDAVAKSLSLYFEAHPDYQFSGVMSFFRDPSVGELIGGYILDRKPIEPTQVQAALTTHFASEPITVALMKQRGLDAAQIIPDFLVCYRRVLSEQLNLPEMAILLEVVEQSEGVVAEIKASEARMKDYIQQLLESRLSPEALAAAYQENQQAVAADLAQKMGAAGVLQVDQAGRTIRTRVDVESGLGRSSDSWAIIGSSLQGPPRSEHPDQRQDWDGAIDTGAFYGRRRELTTLVSWIIREDCRLVALVGIGGVGKTSLAKRVAERISPNFDYLFWRDLRNPPQPDELLGDCIRFLSGQGRVDLPRGVSSRVSLLMECLLRWRCLLVLDNAESILRGGSLVGQYQHGYEGYGELIRQVGQIHHRSCLLITSREKPKEMATMEGDAAKVRSLHLGGLGLKDSRKLIDNRKIRGNLASWRRLVDHYSGNPLALRIVSATIQSLFGGDITGFLERGATAFGGIRDLLDEQIDRLSALEKDIIYWLAVEREPVSAESMLAYLVRPTSPRALQEALGSLRDRYLIEASGASFALQPVVMEYLTDLAIGLVVEEIQAETSELLLSHALVRADAKHYVRNTQAHLILEPVAQRLLMSSSRADVEGKLFRILERLQHELPRTPGYAAGNAINLLIQMQSDLTGCDFSRLTVWEACLQDTDLHDVNFAYCDLSRSAFTENFVSVLSVALSPDGRLLAAGTANGEIRVWQTHDNRQLLSLEGHTEWVRSIAFFPDGRTLLSGSDDQTMRVWDVALGQCLDVIQGYTDRVRSVAIDPSGSKFASGSDDLAVRLWDSHTHQCLRSLEGHTGRIWCVAFSPDGRTLATGSEDNTIRLWDVETGRCLFTLGGHTKWVWSVNFSPDGCRLASSSDDQSVRLWDTSNGKCCATLLGHTNRIGWVVFSPDGHSLASGSDDQTVRLWDTTTGRCYRTLQGHDGWIRSVAFTRDSRALASGSDDRTVRLWDIHSGECLTILRGYANWLGSVAFSPHEFMVATGSDDQTVKLWSSQTGKRIRIFRGHTGRVRSVAFSPDGRIIASGCEDETRRLWDVRTGLCLRTLHGPARGVWSVAFDLTGNLLASASGETIQVWDIRTGQCLRIFQGHTSRVWTVAFSPDGKLLASGSDGQSVRLWELDSGRCLAIMRGHTNPVWSVAFSPDARSLASGSGDRTVRLWDLNGGNCLQIFRGHTNRVRSVMFSPDGGMLASGSDDQTARLWGISSATCLRVLEGHGSQVCSVAFSHDGLQLACSTSGGTVVIWSPQKGERLMILTDDRPYERMNITGVTGLTDAQRTTLRALGALGEP